MRPLFKTWLTICLLLPLAAHATNREQRLPTGFSGYTANATGVHANKGSVSKVHYASRSATPKKPTANLSAKQSSDVLSRAVNALGTPYRWGGSSPSKGFDCSGLVKYAFNDIDEVDLPRTSNAMASGHGIKVDQKDLKPGDLLFFNIKSRKVNHVAIYLGNDRFIHAPRTGKRVSIDTLNKPYWQNHYVVAKRVLPKDQQQLSLAKR
ncbi:glycoside hydrolase [Pseudomonas laurentiana]|uniref:C40 family peptidase n=1 Tax=Pseudomonas laurentiana TaxID=2364649 RepID=A0A6I5RRE8_9PSED|nr:C40 family peptidase [Pseudomonas laurentiana]NES10692.1 C40 family peptidase [Pseudomonas laurentiana]GGU61657.1 glycoside hydrolase [Pseudomonas laurentiana]